MTSEQIPIQLEVTGADAESVQELLDMLRLIPGVEILRAERRKEVPGN